jgi:hypothetical protein
VQASVNRLILIGSIVLFLAAILFLGFFIPPLAMAQHQQQTTTRATTTTTPSSPSLSITTTPPLTPEEQEQQNRLQETIAATTANLNETEKQVSGIVYTPRWSEPVWVEPGALSILFAYCLPGEFADSGQEILGGFELEVLESYAVALPQGFMAWMAVVGNQDEDIQNEGRLPAALGVICASDLNDTESRILSPKEQQAINNINQQFITIQNTQITNIDQVINIINNVTGNTTTTTTTPPQNDTGGVTEQPLTVDATADPTQAFVRNVEARIGLEPATIKLDSKVTGGTPPYEFQWYLRIVLNEPIFLEGSEAGEEFDYGEWTKEPSFIDKTFWHPGTYTYTLTITDSNGRTASDSVQITLIERPPEGGEVLLPPETGGEGGQLPGGGLLPGIAPGEEPPPPPPDDTVGGEEGESGPQGGVTEEDQPTEEPDEGGGGDTGGELPPEESTEEPVG